MRFQELVDKHKAQWKTGAGLDTFGTDKCDLCGVTFDSKDVKVWTRKTGKVHFEPCFREWKEKKEKQ